MLDKPKGMKDDTTTFVLRCMVEKVSRSCACLSTRDRKNGMLVMVVAMKVGGEEAEQSGTLTYMPATVGIVKLEPWSSKIAALRTLKADAFACS